jgi:CRISPR-associated protein Csm4
VKLYEITLQPRSAMITPLKGDTLFGHFCWQAAHDPSLVDGGLDQQMARYGKEPFAVFSSACHRATDKETWFLKRPDIPLSFFPAFAGMAKKERIRTAKEIKKRKWMPVTTSLVLKPDQDIFQDIEQAPTSMSHPHNSINRLTDTTGKGMFAPYATQTTWFAPDTMLSVFVLIREPATDIDRILTGMDRIGKWGFGKDASTGMGRFDITGSRELSLPDYSKAEAFYTLAPSVPEKESWQRCFFSPFTRFGKHGAELATRGNPFKNPVVMADEGAVIFPERSEAERLKTNCYTGRAVINVSKIMPQTVVQGYAPVLPITWGES